MKKIVETNNAPAPIGPYSQATMANNTLYVSGQIAIDPVTGDLKTASLEEETHMVLKNLQSVIEEAGLTLEHVVKCSIFLSDMSLFSEVNEIYGQYFKVNPPARECVAVKTLPKNVNVEISAIAVG